MVSTDRISAFDSVLPNLDPGQGSGTDRDVALLVQKDRRPRPQPPARRRSRTGGYRRGPWTRLTDANIRGPRRSGSTSSAWFGGVSRGAAGRSSSTGSVPWPASPCPRGCGVLAASSPSSASRRQPRMTTVMTRTSLAASWPLPGWYRAGTGGSKSSGDPDLQAGPGALPGVSDSCSSTANSNSASSMASLALIDELITPDSSRLWEAGGRPAKEKPPTASTSSRSATT